jgi:hypothetical protein
MLGRFTGYPPALFERGLALEMKDSAFRLYIFFCRVSDRKSTRQFSMSDSRVKAEAGISPRALSDARRELVSLGAIVCERTPGREYIYTLCDLETGQPFPGHPKIPIPYLKKQRQNAPATPNQPLALPSPLNAISTPPPYEQDEAVRFDFGFNWDKQNLQD